VENPQRAYRGRWRWWCRSRLRRIFLPTLRGWLRREVEEVAYRIFFGRGENDRWILIWDDLGWARDDAGGDGGDVALLNSTVLTDDAHAFAMAEDGYLPAGAHAQAFAVWERRGWR